MRFLTVTALAVSIAVTQGLFVANASATSTGSMKMAKCSSGDPAVIVNTRKMTYTMDTPASRNAMKGMMSGDKFVCKSQATKMGAHMMMSGSMKMNGGSMGSGSMNSGSGSMNKGNTSTGTSGSSMSAPNTSAPAPAGSANAAPAGNSASTAKPSPVGAPSLPAPSTTPNRSN